MDKDVVLKAWEVYQGLAQAQGDNCGKVRSIFYTTSSALIAYGFVHSVPFLYVVVALLSLAFFLLESGYKQIQDQYIHKSVEIEKTLNDLIVSQPQPFIPEDGISTSIETPTIRGCFAQIRRKKLFFWAPYLAVLILSLLMWLMRVKGHELDEQHGFYNSVARLNEQSFFHSPESSRAS